MSIVRLRISLLTVMLTWRAAFGGVAARRLAFGQIPRIQRQKRSFAVWSSKPGRSDQNTEYKPYVQSTPSFRRPLSTASDKWIVPKSVTIPEDRLEISFARASGAGGQNVNKVETKVDIRFNVMQADWLPMEVRQRIQDNNANRMNKDGFLNLSSQEYRTQLQNRKKALEKLEEIILKAYPRPVERKVRKGVSKAAKERNKEEKKKRSDIKERRRSVDF
ncbi:hypothetical protein MHU86_8932 [Fragilaria crotonensis]|nr:hypothetical protein MHU86_13895 [Fragilaria crotonensis]KAI2505501.1 hypothetical protein MHU86_8932 [Fragilaria crotonensis]